MINFHKIMYPYANLYVKELSIILGNFERLKLNQFKNLIASWNNRFQIGKNYFLKVKNHLTKLN